MATQPATTTRRPGRYDARGCLHDDGPYTVHAVQLHGDTLGYVVGKPGAWHATTGWRWRQASLTGPVHPTLAQAAQALTSKEAT